MMMIRICCHRKEMSISYWTLFRSNSIHSNYHSGGNIWSSNSFRSMKEIIYFSLHSKCTLKWKLNESIRKCLVESAARVWCGKNRSTRTIQQMFATEGHNSLTIHTQTRHTWGEWRSHSTWSHRWKDETHISTTLHWQPKNTRAILELIICILLLQNFSTNFDKINSNSKLCHDS